MKDKTTFNVRTRRLCMVLRRLRTESGLTMSEVARQIGVTPSKISRAESGKRGITSEDLASLLTIYGTSRGLRAAVLQLHADSELPDLLDRGELNVHEDLEKWMGFEQDATAIHNYEPLLVPGLLQTIPYARAIIASGVKPKTAQDVDDRVAARIARQALLRQPRRPVLDVILHHAALVNRVGGASVMREQLSYLVECAQRPSITIRVLPEDVGAHPGMDGPFVIMDYAHLPSIVHLENKVASLYFDEPADVGAYKLAFDGLLALAYSPERSVELIGTIAAGMA